VQGSRQPSSRLPSCPGSGRFASSGPRSTGMRTRTSRPALVIGAQPADRRARWPASAKTADTPPCGRAARLGERGQLGRAGQVGRLLPKLSRAAKYSRPARRSAGCALVSRMCPEKSRSARGAIIVSGADDMAGLAQVEWPSGQARRARPPCRKRIGQRYAAARPATRRNLREVWGVASICRPPWRIATVDQLTLV
jgi:hypothetical protein